MYELQNVDKHFPGVHALKAVDFTVNRGEIVGLVGENGAGKPTLMKEIAGTLKPDAGEVWLAGRNVTTHGPVARARAGLGRTFQISSLAMEMTALQNVVIGTLGQRARVFRFFANVMKDKQLLRAGFDALEQVGLQDVAQVRTSALSHGQRRQLEVAVALTLRPRVFLMDEPMAGLGAEGSERLTGFLDGLRHQAPILLVEHDMDAVFALADRISVLVYGQIIATGTADEIRANPLVRSAYLGEEGAA